MPRKKAIEPLKIQTLKNVYLVEIEFTTRLLGSQAPANEYFKRKRIQELQKEMKKLERALSKKRLSEEERIAITEKYEKLVEDYKKLVGEKEESEEESRMTVFPRDEDGNPVLLNYQILGMLKETANNFFSKEVSGAKNLISKYFFVEPREINLYDTDGTLIDEVDDILERPLRAWNQGLQQYIVTLTSSEVINPPAKTSFKLIVWGEGVLHPFTEKVIEQMLTIAGEQVGLLLSLIHI